MIGFRLNVGLFVFETSDEPKTVLGYDPLTIEEGSLIADQETIRRKRSEATRETRFEEDMLLPFLEREVFTLAQKLKIAAPPPGVSGDDLVRWVVNSFQQ